MLEIINEIVYILSCIRCLWDPVWILHWRPPPFELAIGQVLMTTRGQTVQVWRLTSPLMSAPQRAFPEPPTRTAPLTPSVSSITSSYLIAYMVHVCICWSCYCCMFIFLFTICLSQQDVNPKRHLLLCDRQREQCMGPRRCSENNIMCWEVSDGQLNKRMSSPRLIIRVMSGPKNYGVHLSSPCPAHANPHRVASPHSSNL